MSLTNTRMVEPLYIVILRNQQAETLLKNWVRDNRVEHTSITGNKMMIHHRNAFDQFMLTWSHSWELVTVWDTWNRRHIYI
jgi:hypothetical protein